MPPRKKTAQQTRRQLGITQPTVSKLPTKAIVAAVVPNRGDDRMSNDDGDSNGSPAKSDEPSGEVSPGKVCPPKNLREVSDSIFKEFNSILATCDEAEASVGNIKIEKVECGGDLGREPASVGKSSGVKAEKRARPTAFEHCEAASVGTSNSDKMEKDARAAALESNLSRDMKTSQTTLPSYFKLKCEGTDASPSASPLEPSPAYETPTVKRLKGGDG